MEISKNTLTEESYLNYLSRYSGVPVFYNVEDHKYFRGLTRQLSDSTEFVSVDIQPSTTLDSLSLKYYGRPDYYWIIADFNRISDPFILLYPMYKKLKIPAMASLTYLETSE